MLDEASAYQLRLYEVGDIAPEQLHQCFNLGPYIQSELDAEPTQYVSFHDVLGWLLNQLISLERDGNPSQLIALHQRYDQLRFEVEVEQNEQLIDVYRLVVEPTEKLSWRIGPHQALQDQPWLMVPALVAVILAYDWFGPEKVRFIGGNVPKESWHQAMYLYMDLLNVVDCPDPRTGPRQGELVCLLPELYDVYMWEQNCKPAAAATKAIVPPKPGSIERQEKLIISAGFTTLLDEVREPLVWQPEHFHRIKQLGATPAPKISSPEPSSSKLANAISHMAEDSPLAAVDGLKHNKYQQVLNTLRSENFVIIVKQAEGVGCTHLVKQVASALVAGTRLINLGRGLLSGRFGQLLHPEVEHAYRHGGVVLIQNPDVYLLHLLLDKLPILPLSDPSRHTTPMHEEFKLVFEVTVEGYARFQHELRRPQVALNTVFMQYDHELWNTLVHDFEGRTNAKALLLEFFSILPPTEANSLHLISTLASVKARHPTAVHGALTLILETMDLLQGEQTVPEVKELLANLVILNHGVKAPAKPTKAEVAKKAEAATPAEKAEALNKSVEKFETRGSEDVAPPVTPPPAAKAPVLPPPNKPKPNLGF